jgi:hypothetical protein
VNLRTFLPPPATGVSPPPAIGDPAPPLPGGQTPAGPLVVAFLRHTGCPFAEWTLRELRTAAERHPEVAFAAVSHADAPATDRWLADVGGGPAMRVLTDPGRTAYAAWGLGRSSLAHFAGRRSLTQVAKLARGGIRNRHPDGTRWQQAGAFAVGADGTVRWRHLPEHAGDLPDLEAAAQAVAHAPG